MAKIKKDMAGKYGLESLINNLPLGLVFRVTYYLISCSVLKLVGKWFWIQLQDQRAVYQQKGDCSQSPIFLLSSSDRSLSFDWSAILAPEREQKLGRIQDGGTSNSTNDLNNYTENRGLWTV